MSEQIKYISDVLFEQDVVKFDKFVFVDFWVEWCGLCKMIVLIFDEVVKDYGDKLQIVKINVDDNQVMFVKFGVCGILMLILFKNGVVVVQKVGVLLKLQFIVFLDSYL